MATQSSLFERSNGEGAHTSEINCRIQPRRSFQWMLKSHRVLRENTAIDRQQSHAVRIVPTDFVDAVGVLQNLTVFRSPAETLPRAVIIERGGLVFRQLEPAQ